ncbi:MAG: MgtC/SapB family protein, partial [bacterium]
MKNFDPLLQAIIVSASLGSLIGLERQWKTQHDESGETETRTGLRTFTLWAIFGAVSAHIASTFIASFYPVAFGSIAFLLALRFVFDPEQPRPFGFTTITAAFLTFTIGSLVYWQQTRVAVILTIFAIILMASKD